MPIIRLYNWSSTSMPITRLYTTSLLPAGPLPDCIPLFCYPHAHNQSVYYCSATNMPIIRLYTTGLLPKFPLPDCILLVCYQQTHYNERSKKERKQKNRWEDNIKKWTGMGFGASLRAAEDREGWKGIDATSSVVPRRPPRLRD